MQCVSGVLADQNQRLLGTDMEEHFSSFLYSPFSFVAFCLAGRALPNEERGAAAAGGGVATSSQAAFLRDQHGPPGGLRAVSLCVGGCIEWLRGWMTEMDLRPFTFICLWVNLDRLLWRSAC